MVTDWDFGEACEIESDERSGDVYVDADEQNKQWVDAEFSVTAEYIPSGGSVEILVLKDNTLIIDKVHHEKPFLQKIH